MAKDKYLYFNDIVGTIKRTVVPLSRLHHIDVGTSTVTMVFDNHQDDTENDAATVSIALTTGIDEEEIVLEQIAKLCANHRGGCLDFRQALSKVTEIEITEVA